MIIKSTHFILLFIFLLITNVCTAQEENVIYFDQNWDTCDYVSHKFYRIEKVSNNLIQVTDYYQNGTIQMTGSRSKDHDTAYWEGYKRHFSENGVISKITYLINNQLNGVDSSFNDEGVLMYSGQNKNNLKHGKIFFYHPPSKSESKLKIELEIDFDMGVYDGEYKCYYSDGALEFLENFVLGKKNGLQEYYFKTGELRRKETYKLDIRTKGICYDLKGNEVDFFERWVNPKFKGNLNQFLVSNMIYPKFASINNITGKVNVQFVVDENGEISALKILNEIHPILAKEAIRVIKLTSGLWEPHLLEGEPLKALFVLPITFSLY